MYGTGTKTEGWKDNDKQTKEKERRRGVEVTSTLKEKPP